MSLESAIQHLLAAKRISAPSQSYAKDNPVEWAKVKAYLEGGARPAGVTTDMGLGLIEIEDVRRTPPPLTPILWGARMDGEVYGRAGTGAPWDAITWDTFEQHAGKKVGVVELGQPFGVHDLNAFDLTRARSAIPLLGMGVGSFTIEQIIAGAADAAIDAWATKIGTQGHPCFFRPWWEMNGNWGYKWQTGAGVTTAEYITAWRRFRTRSDTAGATNVTWVWCPSYFTSAPGSVPEPSPWYPGDAYVDWMGFDAYSFTTETTTSVYGPIYAKLQELAPSKSIIVCETAKSESGTSKATWLADFFVQLQTAYPKIRAFAWFNWNILQGGVRQTWQIESSTEAQAAFAAGIASPYFREQAPLLPLGTKVP